MMERAATDRSLVSRMIGAAQLNNDVYESVERDVDATSQAATVVLVVAIASGIGRLLDDSIGGLIVGFISAFVSWIAWSAVTYWVGKTIFRTENTRVTLGEMLRTLGFAQSPGVLNFLGIIPVIGPLVLFVTAIWSLIAGIVAIRQAMDFSTGRAIATGIVSFIPVAIIVAIILALPRALF
jgi:Yip1 domain